MKEAIEILQGEIGRIKDHIRKMERLSDEFQSDLVKDWPNRLAEIETAVDRLQKPVVANDSASCNKSSPKLPGLEETLREFSPGTDINMDSYYLDGAKAMYKFIAGKIGR